MCDEIIFYVMEIIACARADPWISTPGAWESITLGGRRVRARGAMQLFGGSGQFRRTCGGMNVSRWATVVSGEGLLPLGHESNADSATS